MSALHKIAAILVSLLWGMNFIAAKIALAHFPIFLMLAIRLAIASAVLMPFVKRPAISWQTLSLIAFTMAVFNTGLGYGAMQLGLSASLAAIIDQLRVPLAVLLGIIILKERVYWRTAIGIIIAFVGTIFIVRNPDSLGSPLSMLCSLGGALGWACYNLQVKQLGKVDIFSMLGIVSFLGALQLFACSLIFESHHREILMSASWQQMASIGYLAIGTAIGQAIWFYLLHKYDVSEVVPYSLLVSFFGVIGSVMILSEQLTLGIIIGGITIMGGVTIIVLRRPQVVKIGDNT